jgi:4'-phosphopantetheinyl transferase
LNSSVATIEWLPCPGAPVLGENEIHVWATILNPPANVLANFAATLSPDETERAHRFKFEKHRNRYIAGRGALRAILAQYLDTGAAGLRFGYQENGKPTLIENYAGIHFNLAHTEDLALVAVTRIGLVGVDVECVRPIKNVDELVARFFSPRESESFQKVSDERKPAAFFNLWTRKEAMLKATGEGITRSLSLVEVSFLPGEAARVVAISGDAKAGELWCLKEMMPAKGFAAAVAAQPETLNIEHRTSNVEGENSVRGIVVKCWKWDSEHRTPNIER